MRAAFRRNISDKLIACLAEAAAFDDIADYLLNMAIK